MEKARSSQAALVVLNWVKHSFSLWFSLKLNRKSTGSSKRRYSGFSQYPSVWEIGMFLLEIFTVFNILTLHQIFWTTRNFFKKLEYIFFVQSIKIENATLPYKTALSETNVKTNGMGSTKWSYHKERSFFSNNFIFLKMLFQFKNLL